MAKPYSEDLRARVGVGQDGATIPDAEQFG